MTDADWDERLHIDTAGRDESGSDDHHFPYEPTPYAVLERLADSGYLHEGNLLIDYGCGKGRCAIFLHDRIGLGTIGIESDPGRYLAAVQNEENYRLAGNPGSGILFLCGKAEEQNIGTADAFYFFNPFSVTILRSVIHRILSSFYENERSMKLFFYYPQPDCVAYLMSETELEFFDEISCRDLFPGDNPRESILIFGIG